MVRLCHLAEGFNMKCEIHHGGNSLNNVANLHITMAVPNCEFFEFDGVHNINSQETLYFAFIKQQMNTAIDDAGRFHPIGHGAEQSSSSESDLFTEIPDRYSAPPRVERRRPSAMEIGQRPVNNEGKMDDSDPPQSQPRPPIPNVARRLPSSSPQIQQRQFPMHRPLTVEPQRTGIVMPSLKVSIPTANNKRRGNKRRDPPPCTPTESTSAESRIGLFDDERAPEHIFGASSAAVRAPSVVSDVSMPRVMEQEPGALGVWSLIYS